VFRKQLLYLTSDTLCAYDWRHGALAAFAYSFAN